MKVAVIFHRLGPYHVARLSAAAAIMDLTAVELAAQTREYAWDFVDVGKSFRRVTLFPEGDSRSAASPEVRRRLQAALDTVRPEVVVVPGWADAGAAAGLEWCARHSVPAVVMSESTAWDERRVSWKEWIKRQMVGLCSAGLAGGTPHADYLAQLGLPRERIFLGYDAVDNNYFSTKAEEIRNQKIQGGDESGVARRYFLGSSRFIEKKNLPRLLEAYARYRAMWAESTMSGQSSVAVTAPWDLVLLGDGPLRASLKEKLATLNLQSFVQLPGFKQYPELPAYYASAGAFVHAATTEQWGLVVNEAMASGLPVLVSNRCGCAADLVQEGVNGFTFDPFNIETISEAMLRVAIMEPGVRNGEFGALPLIPLRDQGSKGGGGEAPSIKPPSTSSCTSSATLMQMGQASQRIVAEWGGERFASGLEAAARTARKVGGRKPTWHQRCLLQALLRR